MRKQNPEKRALEMFKRIPERGVNDVELESIEYGLNNGLFTEEQIGKAQADYITNQKQLDEIERLLQSYN